MAGHSPDTHRTHTRTHTGEHSCSNCNSAILFMTDGVADWVQADKEWLVTEREKRGCLAVFTYALGSGADTTDREPVRSFEPHSDHPLAMNDCYER